MKKVVRFSTLAFAVSLLFGCASSSDVDNLQAQIDGLKISVAQVVSVAAGAKSAARNAASSASAAEVEEKRASDISSNVSKRLDLQFRVVIRCNDTPYHKGRRLR